MTAKPMTLRQFFERLPRGGWRLSGMGRIRTDKGYFAQCPVCAANGNIAYRLRWIAAGWEMGLPARIATRIANASDGEYMSPTERRIRRLLLKHCNLTETTT